jgi:hypothetical protein
MPKGFGTAPHRQCRWSTAFTWCSICVTPWSGSFCAIGGTSIVPGGIPGDFERLGVEIDHAGRYAQAEELMQACRALWTGALTDFHGASITLRGARCSPLPHGHAAVLSGGSLAAGRVARGTACGGVLAVD